MEIEKNGKPRVWVVVTGSVPVVEAEVNRLCDEFTVQHWNFSLIKEEVILTAIMIRTSILARAQAAAGPIMIPMPRGR